MNRYLYVLVIVVLIASCVMDAVNARLQIKNNSNYDISVEINIFDTIIHESIMENPAYYISDKISHGEIRRQAINGGKHAWSQFIERSTNKKLNVFIFSTDTIEKYGGFEHIIKQKLYKRYEFAEKELDNINWIIEYP